MTDERTRRWFCTYLPLVPVALVASAAARDDLALEKREGQLVGREDWNALVRAVKGLR